MSAVREDIEADVAAVLGRLRSKGVLLWAHDGQLRYRAPKGALTRQEIEDLGRLSDQLLILLDEHSATAGRALHRMRAPLTFSQLAHWRLHKVAQRPSVRQLASTTRLRGRLRVDVLRQAWVALLERHDALRTRVIVEDGVPLQEVSSSVDTDLAVDDLTTLAEHARQAAVSRLINDLIMEPIHPATVPLLAARVAKIGPDEHVLMVAMEHMISDASSMSILLRDLLSLYEALTQGRSPSLPRIPMQLADYGIWQQRTHPSWLSNHGAYWAQRLDGCQRVRFPRRALGSGSRAGWSYVPVLIDKNTKAELQEWCRAKRTTLVMAVLAAYVALVMRWCNVVDTVVRFQTDGRFHELVEHAIGYFASVLHLRIAVTGAERFIDVLGLVTEEYCNAHEHADGSYIDTQEPRPPYARNCAFNWVPQARSGGDMPLDSARTLVTEPMDFDSPVLREREKDSEPVLLLFEREAAIAGGVYFPLDQFAVADMQRFSHCLLRFIHALLADADRSIQDVPMS